MKDGSNLTTDGSHYSLSQTVTDRTASTYNNVLTVRRSAPGGVAGTYTCTVSNDLGSVNMTRVAVGKSDVAIQSPSELCSSRAPYLGVIISGLYGTLTVGESANISCMTNIPVSSFEWNNETFTLANITGANLTVLEYTINQVKDDLQGHRLTCVAVAGTTVYSETEVVAVRGMCGMKYV